MPIKQSIWRVGKPPVRLLESSSLSSEKLLEEMIVSAPENSPCETMRNFQLEKLATPSISLASRCASRLSFPCCRSASAVTS